MKPEPITQTINLGDGRTITLETGKLAKQADGAVVLRMDDTMLLATVVSPQEARADVDFLPLTVEYKEKYSATGKFPGGFFKREARPLEHEILIARLVDRVLRPLFPEDYHSEIQIIISLISADKDATPDALAGLAASAALAVSDIPFNGPISEVRVARIDGRLVINPPMSLLEKADIDLIVGGSEESIVMVEGEMKEVSEEEMVDAIEFAHEAIKKQCAAQRELASKVEKARTKREYAHEADDEELKQRIEKELYDELYAIAKSGIADKAKRKEAFKSVREAFKVKYGEELGETALAEKEALINRYFHETEKKAVRDCILNEGKRLDGRGLADIRPIWCEVDYLPAAHGSAIFTRGETQSLTTVTIGTKFDVQIIDSAIVEGTASFLLHYNFPPFSTGEVKRLGSTSRREIGHGNLALRALKPMVPVDQYNPYTIRVVSDILESNGSSSMATVCAGSLALMDAGVKIKKHVSGIAMGLITDKETGKYAVLSDILGDEDHLGDMDFKVTGTRDGITACQMDIKVSGLSKDILLKALKQAKEGRLHILDIMEETIAEPRPDFKPHAPRITQVIIPKETIGAVIGPGGKIIQEMQTETGTTIHIEEVNGEGHVHIYSNNKESVDAVLEKIKQITAVPEEGAVYEATVKAIMPYGAFVEFLPGKEGLLHISEISWSRIENVEDVFKPGDKVKVKLIGIDPRSGKYKLSRKVLIPKPDFRKEKSS